MRGVTTGGAPRTDAEGIARAGVQAAAVTSEPATLQINEKEINTADTRERNLNQYEKL